MGGRLSTGVHTLDRRLDGGLHPGDLVAVVTPPATQSHALLYQLMKQRPTLYVTTLRSVSAIQRELETIEDTRARFRIADVAEDGSMDNQFLQELTGSRTYSVTAVTEDDILDDVYESIGRVDDEANVILDPMNPLERTDNRNAYQEVLNRLKSKMMETGGVGVLHCITLGDPPPLRETTLILADIVWELDVVSARSGDVEFQLRIPKNRGGQAVLEEITLEVDLDTVRVDDSRAI